MTYCTSVEFSSKKELIHSFRTENVISVNVGNSFSVDHPQRKNVLHGVVTEVSHVIRTDGSFYTFIDVLVE